MYYRGGVGIVTVGLFKLCEGRWLDDIDQLKRSTDTGVSLLLAGGCASGAEILDELVFLTDNIREVRTGLGAYAPVPDFYGKIVKKRFCFRTGLRLVHFLTQIQIGLR